MGVSLRTVEAHMYKALKFLTKPSRLFIGFYFYYFLFINGMGTDF